MLSAPRLMLNCINKVLKYIDNDLTEKIFANPHGCYRKIKSRKKVTLMVSLSLWAGAHN